MARSMTFTVYGKIDTVITITELDDGSIRFDVAVDERWKVGDLRGVFFDMEGYTAGSELYVLQTADHQDVTDFAACEESIVTLGRDANIRGSVVRELGAFDVGVEIGTSGTRRDDIQETSFIIASTEGPLTLEMFENADIGLRYTSVGYHCWRFWSAKVGGETGDVADSDAFAVEENQIAALNLLDNDTYGDERSVVAAVDDQGEFTQVYHGFERTVIIDGREIGVIRVGGDGQTTFDANGADIDFLAAGETLEYMFAYATEEGNGSTSMADVTITIEGANDAPMILVESVDSDFAALFESDEGLTANWTLTLTDADVSDIVTVSVVSVAVAGAVSDIALPPTTELLTMLSVSAGAILSAGETRDSFAWIFISGDEAFDDLNAGETLELTYTLRATDSQGATADQNTTITIAGTNDAPIAVDDAGTLPEDGTAVFDVLANDRDDEGDDLTVTIIDEGDGQFTGPSRKVRNSARSSRSVRTATSPSTATAPSRRWRSARPTIKSSAIRWTMATAKPPRPT